jgi:hypothetical protein
MPQGRDLSLCVTAPFFRRGLVTFLLILAHSPRKSFSTGWDVF